MMEGNHSNAPAKTHVAPHPLPTEPHPTCPALVLMNLALDLTTWTQRHEMCISFPVCDLCRFGKHSHKLRDRGGLGVSAVRAKTGKWIVPTDRIIKWLDRKSLKLVLRTYSKLKHTHTHAHAHTHRDRHRHTHTHTHTQTHTHTHTRARTHSQTFGLVLCCRWNRVCVGALGALEKNSSSADGFAVWKSIHVKIVVSSDHFKSLQKLSTFTPERFRCPFVSSNRDNETAHWPRGGLTFHFPGFASCFGCSSRDFPETAYG